MSFYRVIEDFYGVLELGTFNTLEEAQDFVEEYVNGSKGRWLNKYRWLSRNNKMREISIYPVKR